MVTVSSEKKFKIQISGVKRYNVHEIFPAGVSLEALVSGKLFYREACNEGSETTKPGTRPIRWWCERLSSVSHPWRGSLLDYKKLLNVLFLTAPIFLYFVFLILQSPSVVQLYKVLILLFFVVTESEIH